MSDVVRKTSLVSTHLGAHKAYNVLLVAVSGGFLVQYQNGKVGKALASGTKTAAPVTREAADEIFDALVKSKVNGSSHYQVVGDDGISAAVGVSVQARELSGLQPMLLIPVDDDAELQRLLNDDRYVAQQKHDGERVGIVGTDAGAVGSQKQGFKRQLPADIAAELARLPDVDLDGEMLGDRYVVFDVTRHQGEDVHGLCYSDRLRLAGESVASLQTPIVEFIATAVGHQAKQALFDRLQAARAEGIVFKRLDGVYEAGESLTCRKYKFRAENTVLVDEVIAGKRSVRMAALDSSGKYVQMGKVTIPSNFDIPAVGATIEVQYRHAMPGTHALIEPVYRGCRTDQRREDCLLSKLRYAPEGDVSLAA